MTTTSDEKRKDYLKKYRENNIHRVVIFSKNEYDLLMSEAEKNRKGFSTTVRDLALGQLKNKYVLPLDEQTHEAKILLIRIGTNINQISKIANSKNDISFNTVKKVRTEFTTLQKALIAIYDKPLRLSDLIRNTLIKNPRYVEEIKKILKQLHL